MKEVSAGVLLYRQVSGGTEVLLGHFGGPFFARKDVGAWGLPKGHVEPGEALEVAARRELKEETGIEVTGELLSLGSVTQKSGKVVHAWAARGDFDPAALKSNTFELVWPPGSGQVQRFPELDRVAWLDLETARSKVVPAQAEFLARLAALLAKGS
ncbi:MAG: NUDIX domain-containing protein [Archangiaceae bacterium]|nr:NUDIX domain-containing protein [Archangiaceae bacterium]